MQILLLLGRRHSLVSLQMQLMEYMLEVVLVADEGGHHLVQPLRRAPRRVAPEPTQRASRTCLACATARRLQLSPSCARRSLSRLEINGSWLEFVPLSERVIEEPALGIPELDLAVEGGGEDEFISVVDEEHVADGLIVRLHRPQRLELFLPEIERRYLKPFTLLRTFFSQLFGRSAHVEGSQAALLVSNVEHILAVAIIQGLDCGQPEESRQPSHRFIFIAERWSAPDYGLAERVASHKHGHFLQTEHSRDLRIVSSPRGLRPARF